jgi:NADPH-dependent 2,4-dienoyl-CoA reductase/sulfur reductase-like enzyme
MASQRLVIVGACLAGLRAAEAARKVGFAGEVTLVGAERHLPYDRPPLSKEFLQPSAGHPDATTYREETKLRDELGIDLRLSTTATGLDTAAKTVTLSGEHGGALGYTTLVIATGAAPRTLPGADGLPGVHTLRTVDDSLAIRGALERGARTVVVGAGFIGSEMASAARLRNLPVTVVEMAETPLTGAVGPRLGEVLCALHRKNGTDLRLGVGVQSIDGRDGVEGVTLSDGTRIPAEMVVLGTGAAPATGWLRDSAVPLDERDGGVLADANLYTGVPGVYAAGDVVHWHNPVFDEMMRLEHWTSAAEQGARAAKNAVAPEAAVPYETVPYFWSDLYGHRIQLVGVPDADELRVVEGQVDDDTFVACYRKGDRVVGTVTIDQPAAIMKYRRQIANGASWQELLDFAAARVTARQEKKGTNEKEKASA